MQDLKKQNGIDYFENVNFIKIVSYLQNPNPVYGECLTSLLLMDDLILIPILNEVYCKRCGTKKLNEMHYYKEDEQCQQRRTKFYKNFFENGKLEY